MTGRAVEEGQPGAPLWLCACVFVGPYAMWQWGYQSLRGGAWEAPLINGLTAQPAAAWLRWLYPADAVIAVDGGLAWPGGRLMLRAGCDGFEMMGLYVSALLVSPVGWCRGMLALFAGCVLVWLLNQLRIGALYLCVRHLPSAFDATHALWAPIAMLMALAAVYACFVPLRGGSAVPTRAA